MAKHIEVSLEKKQLFFEPKADITNNYVFEVIEEIYDLTSIHKLSHLFIKINKLNFKIDTMELLFGSLSRVKDRNALRLKIALVGSEHLKLLRLIETFYLNRGYNIQFFQQEEDAQTWLSNS